MTIIFQNVSPEPNKNVFWQRQIKEFMIQILIVSSYKLNYLFSLYSPGIANSNKVIVEFQHMFWPADVGIFLRAVQGNEGLGFMQSWLNIHRFVKVRDWSNRILQPRNCTPFSIVLNRVFFSNSKTMYFLLLVYLYFL